MTLRSSVFFCLGGFCFISFCFVLSFNYLSFVLLLCDTEIQSAHFKESLQELNNAESKAPRCLAYDKCSVNTVNIAVIVNFIFMKYLEANLVPKRLSSFPVFPT